MAMTSTRDSATEKFWELSVWTSFLNLQPAANKTCFLWLAYGMPARDATGRL